MKSLLSDNFFRILEINSADEPEKIVKASLELNREHAVYNGHFPGTKFFDTVYLPVNRNISLLSG